MIKELAPLTPSSPPLHGANTGRWRVVVGCLSLTLLGHTFPASPAFSYKEWTTKTVLAGARYAQSHIERQRVYKRQMAGNMVVSALGTIAHSLFSLVLIASPAFSYSGELDSYLASKFIVPIADSHRQQYMRQAGLPSGMLRYYEPHPWGTGPHPFSSYCCNQQDCGFAKPGSVTWTPDGYRVMMPDGEIQMVPEDSPAIRFQYEKGHEKETRFAACIMQKGAAIDAYLNNLSPGAVESPSAWYVRCLYIGRSGQ